MPDPKVSLDRDNQLVVDRGREAWRTLRMDETWEKWVAIGRAIEAGKLAVMRVLHTNQPRGGAWGRVFGQWLEENSFDEIDKGVRSRLQSCVDHLAEIEAWRAALGLSQRLQLNHPNAVLRRWQATRQVGPAPDGAAGNGARPGLREENMRLQGELDAALRRLKEHEDDGADWTWQDKPEDIARAMLARYPDKAKRLGSALLKQAKAEVPIPRRKQPEKPA